MGEDQKRVESNIFRLPESAGQGMSWARFSEIEKADKDGAPLEISDDERAEYQEARSSLLDTMDRFRDSITVPYNSMFQKLGRITSSMPSSMTASATEPVSSGASRHLQRSLANTTPYAVLTQETLDNIAAAKQQEHDREERNSENIGLTAQVMQEMLAAMHAQAVTAEERDDEAKKAAARNYWVALGSLVFAVLAVVAPFVIETIKGWK